MAVEIPLTQGYVTLVDDDDAERVRAFKWQAFVRPGRVYAARTARYEGERRTIYLHRWLMGASQGVQIDHKNRDTLDNRRSTNLRLASCSENHANATGRGGFKGVTFDKARNKWKSQVGFRGTHLNIGRFDTEIEAARAYDRMAAHLFGQFALLNFPEEADRVT